MKCPNCQTSNPDEAKFCMNCAMSLAMITHATNGGISDVQVNNQTLEKFIPRELMAKFEAARAHDAMVGERRVITMLFCDVKGSTAAAEKVDPETWTDIMNGIFECMIRPIYKYEGTVPRLMGDAKLASLEIVNSKLGKHNEAEENRKESRAVIQQIAESLHEVGLSESFLNQPRVQKLMR